MKRVELCGKFTRSGRPWVALYPENWQDWLRLWLLTPRHRWHVDGLGRTCKVAT